MSERTVISGITYRVAACLLAVALCLCGCFQLPDGAGNDENSISVDQTAGEERSVESTGGETGYSGAVYEEQNGNVPTFTTKEKESREPFEKYKKLDSLGRCGTAYANVCRELMPVGERKPISSVKPSGWQSAKYDIVEGKYLYNRCHLIGYQLTGENANKKNLITGTRYMNVEGMLPFEDRVAEYVKRTGNHVLYRVTPVYEGDNLVAGSVQMEGYSVEDAGKGICFNVMVYNVQPGIRIDYSDGSSRLQESSSQVQNDGKAETEEAGQSYVLNTNTKKFHRFSCGSVQETQPENRENFTGNRKELIQKGYQPCRRCKP